jgi:hypothetical protein
MQNSFIQWFGLALFALCAASLLRGGFESGC